MEGNVRSRSILLVVSLTLLGLIVPASGEAQQPEPQPIDEEMLTTYARAYTQIGDARDEIQAELARTANKTADAQSELQTRLRERVAGILGEHGLTEEEYADITFLISVNEAQRQAFAAILERLEEG